MQTMDEELTEAAEELKEKQKIRAAEQLKFADLEQYKIKGDDMEWEKALGNKGTKGLISVKSGTTDQKSKKDEKKKRKRESFEESPMGKIKKKKKNKN